MKLSLLPGSTFEYYTTTNLPVHQRVKKSLVLLTVFSPTSLLTAACWGSYLTPTLDFINVLVALTNLPTLNDALHYKKPCHL